MTDLSVWLPRVVEAIRLGNARFGTFDPDPSLAVGDDVVEDAVTRLTDRLADTYPFFHPRYVGQMLKPPHPAAVIGYTAAMLLNPNNHALDGGPATSQLEREVVARLAAMLGVDPFLGHLTSSGTIANLEALWVAREERPGTAVAYSADAHYTHARMCQVIGVPGVAVPTDAAGRMDVEALAAILADGSVGTVVATLGTTGLGALDPVDEIVDVARAHGVRVHVDAAYGGFFALVADDSEDGVPAAPFAAVARADSVVIDPHKHGLQPYGCGAVLFADPAVARHYLHDSPYTYFTSDDLHLGEISLECSRAGAAAAALWLTLEVVPLTGDGLGRALRAGLRGARAWHGLLAGSDVLVPFQRPELDIVTYLPRRSAMSEIDARTAHLAFAAADAPPAEQVHVAQYAVTPAALTARGHEVVVDRDSARICRSVVMKPESAAIVPELHARLESLLR
ncbi:MAG: aminotransferase class I/II-fold pyridoxal phosphate-dependent enzyme [Candidatus Nanopelagicales bacterium]